MSSVNCAAALLLSASFSEPAFSRLSNRYLAVEMASIVWGRHPQEAYDNPYEYDAQDQFVREAKELLTQLQLKLDRFTMAFHRDDQTLEKATWMLALDLIDALLESVQLFEEKRHRIAFRLFRDVVETMDLLRVLHSNKPLAMKALHLWYEDETESPRVPWRPVGLSQATMAA